MKKAKVIVIIDGSNFYYKLKELKLPNLSSFDYDAFVNWLTRKETIKSKYYCIGKIHAGQNDRKARNMMANQQSLVTKLQKNGFTIQFGYLLKIVSSNCFLLLKSKILHRMVRDGYRSSVFSCQKAKYFCN